MWHTSAVFPVTGMQAGIRSKASKAYIRLLESAKKNAEYVGLDAENLEIIHALAQRGRAQKAFFPRAMGRATPKVRESVSLEVIVREVA